MSTLSEPTRRAASIGRAALAATIRALAADAVEAANSGHPGMPLGMADVATVLLAEHLRFDPSDPGWIDRDRLVLSAGHGSMLLYSILWLTGVAGVELDDLKTFRQLGSRAAGHPEHGHMPGVETTTGPLGQGLATAVGMAMAERRLRAEFGADLIDHRTIVIAGDGCLMEGLSQEAISLAGHHRLERLVVLFDDNEITIDGATALATSDDQLARFAASGWRAERIAGHDHGQISAALRRAEASDRPSLIACRTVIGRGAPTKQGSSAAHGAPLGAADVAALHAAAGWGDEPFDVPAEVLAAWREIGARATAARRPWDAALAARPAEDRERLLARLAPGPDLDAVRDACDRARQRAAADRRPLATRAASQRVLEELVGSVPELFGGSADLSESNLTRVAAHRTFSPSQPDGDYIHFGVREHAMAAALNGIALHGGFVAFGGTFLAFADYCRPAIRLSALMGLPVVYVMTHDSIWLGEDGPTHQPVEHIESLRAIPNLLVLRPADAAETADAWEVALSQTDRPSLLCLTRHGVPPLPPHRPRAAGAHRGAAVVVDPGDHRDATIIATGSEVCLAVAAAERLAAEGIRAAVVSMLCVELFTELDEAERDTVLGTAPRVVIEAGVAGSWHRWLRDGDRFIGMTTFGASGPGPAVAEHFGITTAAVVETVHRLLPLA